MGRAYPLGRGVWGGAGRCGGAVLLTSLLLATSALAQQVVYKDDQIIMGYISPVQTADVRGYPYCFTSVGDHLWVRSDWSLRRASSFKVFVDGGFVKISKNKHADGRGTFVCYKDPIVSRRVTSGYVPSGTTIGKNLACVVNIGNFEKVRIRSGTVNGTVSCMYSPGSGLIQTQQTEAGRILHCGYVCVDTAVQEQTRVSSNSFTARGGTANIGVGLNCATGTHDYYSPCSTTRAFNPLTTLLYEPYTGVMHVGDTNNCSGRTLVSSFSYFCVTPQCQDGIDNDGDGLIDAADPGCWTDPRNPASYDPRRNDEGSATTQCQDGIDNDGDGLIDAADPGCWTNPQNPASYDPKRNHEGAATSECQDGIDNDGDGLIDAADPGCWADPQNPASYDPKRYSEALATTQCQDGVDNDNDGLIDAEDPGCWTNPRNPATYDRRRNNEAAATTECQDGIDNDGDGLIDAADPGCWTNPSNPATYDRRRNNEAAATTECQDGIDNDGDGLIDAADPGCWERRKDRTSYNPRLNNEAAATTECQDGIDNDCDGFIDMADPGCRAPTDDDESRVRGCMPPDCLPPPGCFPPVPPCFPPGCIPTPPPWVPPCVPPGCTPPVPPCLPPHCIPQCQDGIDNDGDGRIDAQDPGCWRDVNDSLSYDRNRNDESDDERRRGNGTHDDPTTPPREPALQGGGCRMAASEAFAASVAGGLWLGLALLLLGRARRRRRS